jgi:hypothetical protein
MDDVCTYQIHVRGQVAQADIASFSPPNLRLEQSGESCTVMIFRADQSGFIGVLRQLHGLGLVIVSVETEPQS